MSKKINHIAIIRLSAMGDVAMTIPVIMGFVQQNPTVKITVISRPFYKPFFEGISNVDFFEVDLKQRHKGFIGLLKLYTDLKKLQIDAIADLHNVIRSKVIRNLFALNGKKIAFTDKGREEKKALTSLNNKVFKPLKTMFDRHVKTFNQLGFTIDLSKLNFPEKKLLTVDILDISGFKKAQYWIGIAPFAQYKSKVYPEDLMQEVIDAVALNHKNKIFLFGGGSDEIEILNRFSNLRENVVVVAGKLNLSQELKLISNVDVMLSMDSGNAHIAAMLGIKVITLWGSTHPFAGFAPFNQPFKNCLLSNRDQFPLLPTSVYGNKFVEGYQDVMRTISVEKVVESIEKNF